MEMMKFCLYSRTDYDLERTNHMESINRTVPLSNTTVYLTFWCKLKGSEQPVTILIINTSKLHDNSHHVV